MNLEEDDFGPIGRPLPQDDYGGEEPLAPIPPRLTSETQNEEDFSTSPAFQCLKELFHEGRISGVKAAELKAKFISLRTALRNSWQNESELLEEAKRLTTTLENQKADLEQQDNFPANVNTEVGKLRIQLLNYQNELAQAEERQYSLEYRIEGLHEEKRVIEQEYGKVPKAGEIEKRVKTLEKEVEDVKHDIATRLQECRNLKEELETRTRANQFFAKETEVVQEEMEKHRGELQDISLVPGQLAKEADKLSRKRDELEKKRMDLEKGESSLRGEIKIADGHKTELSEEKYDLESKLDRQQQALEEKQIEYDQRLKEMEYAKEKEVNILSERTGLDLTLRHTNMDKKTQQDNHARWQREKDRELRLLKKTEVALKLSEDSLLHTKSVYDKVKHSYDTYPKDDGSLMNRRKELSKEVEQTKRAFAQQNSLTAVEQLKVENSIAEEQALLYQQTGLRAEVVELTRLAAIKADEREQKARDFMRAETRYHRAVEDLKMKTLNIQDHEKKFREVQVRLRDFAKLYDVIKNERNKCVNLIQQCAQRASEMREKIKILQNEIEILRTSAQQKDRLLQKQRLRLVNSQVIRDNLRNAKAKQQHIATDLAEKRDQQRMDIAKLNLMINASEEQMVQLRKRYEQAVQSRNERGLQLIERNEEVCIFNEKVSIQEAKVADGISSLNSKEEELRFLRLEREELQRQVGLKQKDLPNRKNLNGELATVQIQLSQCKDRISKLEAQSEDPQDKSRVRILEGKDPLPGDMHKKIEDLEIHLATKEEQLMEKLLLLEQVERLSARLQLKVDSGKGDTLDLAKKINQLQNKIKDVTRKMMGLVSELSMQQAEALRLQQITKEKQQLLDSCYERLERGEGPCDQFQREWQHQLQRESLADRAAEQRRLAAEEEEPYILPGGIYTTAEPRPNAYIPDDQQELPIPRPYGAHAPFKPQDAGSNIRHIKKPVVKPIEI